MISEEIGREIPAGKPIVVANHGRAITNSRNVADCFEKRHGNVVRNIKNLLTAMPPASQLTFELAEYMDDQGKSRPSYNMDRDAFTLVAMSFTGPKALRFKLAYIAEFNRMEAALHRPAANDDQPGDHRQFPDWPMDELRAKRGVIDTYRKAFGPLGAQWLMPQLGFPVPPRDLVELGRQLWLALDGLPPDPANAYRKSA